MCLVCGLEISYKSFFVQRLTFKLAILRTAFYSVCLGYSKKKREIAVQVQAYRLLGEIVVKLKHSNV